jgi:REP-associated tyrosine transposase
MGRPLRTDAPGALHHVYSRGAVQLPVFVSDGDREMFLGLLCTSVERSGWLCHGYCLMSNHYHLVLETPQPTLAKGMHRLNHAYAKWVNLQTGRLGHAFDARYGSSLIETAEHELEVARYVALNPVTAGMCRAPEQWRWSSYRAQLGLDRQPSFLTVARVLGHFAGDPAAYRRFVDDGQHAHESRATQAQEP